MIDNISYYHREEPIYNRSEWRRGKSVEFKTRDSGFASPQQRRRRVQFIILQTNSFQFSGKALECQYNFKAEIGVQSRSGVGERRGPTKP